MGALKRVTLTKTSATFTLAASLGTGPVRAAVIDNYSARWLVVQSDFFVPPYTIGATIQFDRDIYSDVEVSPGSPPNFTPETNPVEGFLALTVYADPLPYSAGQVIQGVPSTNYLFTVPNGTQPAWIASRTAINVTASQTAIAVAGTFVNIFQPTTLSRLKKIVTTTDAAGRVRIKHSFSGVVFVDAIMAIGIPVYMDFDDFYMGGIAGNIQVTSSVICNVSTIITTGSPAPP